MCIKMLKILNGLNLKTRSITLMSKSKVPLQSKCRQHSTFSSTSMNVYIVPALQDNYMYVLMDNFTKSTVVVDPVEPSKVLKLIEKEKANLLAVLTTHHHLDHCGGNSTLLDMIGKVIPVYGGDDRIASLNKKITHDETFVLDRFSVRCLFTPCHTNGHMCYYVQNENNNCDPICFTGDTLFVGGCGRFFEGSAENMYNSLKILQSLPDNTKVFCGHEYTVNNMKFALHVEPDNKHVAEKLAWALDKQSKQEPTVPSSIGQEMLHNPFMRVCKESVKKFTKQNDPIAVMQTLRNCKDAF